MKAFHVTAFGPLESHGLAELPDPRPGPGELLIQVACCDVNFPDILVVEGRYQVKPPLPFIPGKAAAGTIVAVGEGVTDRQVGERVLAQVEYGAFTEQLVVKAALVQPIPEALSFEQATALGLVYQTAWFALTDRAGLQPGERVLVLGASGGVGMAALQLAKALGASQVLGGARGAEKLALARDLGADAVVDLAAEDLANSLRDQVRAVTDGAGVDAVIDPVGGAATQAALRALAWRGRLVVIGFAAGEIPTIKANYLLVKNIAVSGLQWSDYRDRDPAWMARAQEQIFAFAAAGQLDPHIAEVFPLAKAGTALARLRDGQAAGKILLRTGA
ncbi:MAG: NADPH:quinone oxidoreductase family protein [Pseudomonadota bacterium]